MRNGLRGFWGGTWRCKQETFCQAMGKRLTRHVCRGPTEGICRLRPCTWYEWHWPLCPSCPRRSRWWRNEGGQTSPGMNSGPDPAWLPATVRWSSCPREHGVHRGQRMCREQDSAVSQHLRRLWVLVIFQTGLKVAYSSSQDLDVRILSGNCRELVTGWASYRMYRLPEVLESDAATVRQIPGACRYRVAHNTASILKYEY